MAVGVIRLICLTSLNVRGIAHWESIRHRLARQTVVRCFYLTVARVIVQRRREEVNYRCNIRSQRTGLQPRHRQGHSVRLQPAYEGTNVNRG
jgi:hypothetical protein